MNGWSTDSCWCPEGTSMQRPLFLLLCLAIALTAVVAVRTTAAEAPPDPAQVEFFEKQVRPVLADNCFQCHGPEKQKGELRLDSRAALLQGGESGPAIVPGQPEKSLLIKAVHQADDLKMPPKSKLSEQQLAALTTWVKMGAAWPATASATRAAPASNFKITAKDRAFWSFQPVKQSLVPLVKNTAWPRSPLDAFV